MPFRDMPPEDPFVRLFYSSNQLGQIVLGQLVFSAHGLWDPAVDGLTRLTYTYNWYTQPTAALTGQQYADSIGTIGTAAPVDTSGPGSGQVPNTRLLPLDPTLFTFTVQAFHPVTNGPNPNGLALLAFMGNATVKGMRLNQLDTQLLPYLQYATNRPVHMVVCRSLALRHVVPAIPNRFVVVPAMTPFNSITDDML